MDGGKLQPTVVTGEFTAVDLFAGAGGSSQGLRDAGFQVLGAVENDEVVLSFLRCHAMTDVANIDGEPTVLMGAARALSGQLFG